MLWKITLVEGGFGDTFGVEWEKCAYRCVCWREVLTGGDPLAQTRPPPAGRSELTRTAEPRAVAQASIYQKRVFSNENAMVRGGARGAEGPAPTLAPQTLCSGVP